MSTTSSIKYGRDDTGVAFFVYKNSVDAENVYLDLTGFPIEVVIPMDDIKPRITVRFSLAWAVKLGIVDQEYVARHEQLILEEKAKVGPTITWEQFRAMKRRKLTPIEAGLDDQGMKPSDLKIGLEFWMSGSRWRCTDVGSRVVIAIKLDHDDDPTWYYGPPYKVVESALDEYDLMVCSLRHGEGNS